MAEREQGSEVKQEAAGRSGRRHWLVVAVCLGFIGGMAGMTAAAVPLYRAFCSLTGYGGATRTAEGEALPTPIDKTMEIRFDANVAPGLAWTFKPVQTSMTVTVGKSSLAHYEAVNRADAETHANATYNVMPAQAGSYFVKLQCFCFDEQTLGPKEKADMPVVFYVDPDIVKDPDLQGINTITLSYTFFPAKDQAAPVARTAQENSAQGKAGQGAQRKPL
jgi:cytochrome c oxidase assembly protein subunit 11